MAVVSQQVTPPSSNPPALMTTPSSLELANQLKSVGSYAECAVEALRHAYLHPGAGADAEERQAGFDRAALCLSLADRFRDARKLMLTLADAGPLGARARLRLCLTEVFLGDLGAPMCADTLRDRSDPALDGLSQHTLVMRALGQRKWREAEERLSATEGRSADVADAPAAGVGAGTVGAGRGATPATAGSGDRQPADNRLLTSWREQDRAFLRRQAELPHHSPWLAAALSTVVPGLGRVYLGRWPDGLMTFVLIGALAGLSAHGFYVEGQDSVRGWLLGGTAVLFHLGNIYGSAVGARVIDREQEDALVHDIHREHRRRLEP